MSLNAHDPMTEQALLGVTMHGNPDTVLTFTRVPTEAFWSERHKVIAGILQDMAVRTVPIDPVSVAAELESAGFLGKIGGLPYLHTLAATLGSPANAMYYADRLCELYGRRQLQEACVQQAQMLDADPDRGADVDVDYSSKQLEEAIIEARRFAAGMHMAAAADFEEFMGESDQHDWLVPGLLERGDRLILTGVEGLGKSELTSQISMCLAAGMHPFTGEPLGDGGHGIRVLWVDLENGRSQLRRRWRRIAAVVQAARDRDGLGKPDWKENLLIQVQPGGIDLLSGKDGAWLESLVANAKPDLLTIGPLYKMHTEDENDGRAARKMTSTLDGIRTRHRCALITEAHAGHGTDDGGDRKMRPIGSSLYLRWPEFGFGLRERKNEPGTVDVVQWRGQREERDWPRMVHRGGFGRLPWVPSEGYYDTGEWTPTAAVDNMPTGQQTAF